ncbi:hypothetical protein L226DRAFT_606842 [Lentinus tigrinus ALCF2SS1-7]|uniref:uncharacterized protein n=1 Tax=Lentinus tigrinus ALCF2SS1-7 TaxID=1328758 RepID=UPI0011663F4F|nr:hypothetical protein L226DRAFT_606842 [Lentinus tigrinus ALCF2SS1-7]
MSSELARSFRPSPWSRMSPTTWTSSTTVPAAQTLNRATTSQHHRVHSLFLAFAFVVVGATLFSVLLRLHYRKIGTRFLYCIRLGVDFAAVSGRFKRLSHPCRTMLWPLQKHSFASRRTTKEPDLRLVWAAIPHSLLCRSVYATSLLYCNSDDFSWALLHAVYLSLVSVELAASIRTPKRVTAEELGPFARLRAADGESAGNGADVRSSSTGNCLSIQRVKPSVLKFPTTSNLGSFLRAEHMKTRRELSDIVWTSTTDTLILRAVASTPSVRWALDTNGVLVDRLCPPPLASLVSSAARVHAALDDFLHAEHCRKPRNDWICAVWDQGLAARGTDC